MCNKKIKCNLLAAVLILTVLQPTVAIGRPIIEHCCFIISQKLMEGSEVRRVWHLIDCSADTSSIYSYR